MSMHHDPPMPAWFRRTQFAVGCVAVGILIGIGIADWLGSTLFNPGVSLLIYVCVFLLAVVPITAIDVAIRLRRLSRQLNRPQLNAPREPQ